MREAPAIPTDRRMKVISKDFKKYTGVQRKETDRETDRQDKRTRGEEERKKRKKKEDKRSTSDASEPWYTVGQHHQEEEEEGGLFLSPPCMDLHFRPSISLCLSRVSLFSLSVLFFILQLCRFLSYDEARGLHVSRHKKRCYTERSSDISRREPTTYVGQVYVQKSNNTAYIHVPPIATYRDLYMGGTSTSSIQTIRHGLHHSYLRSRKASQQTQREPDFVRAQNSLLDSGLNLLSIYTDRQIKNRQIDMIWSPRGDELDECMGGRHT